MKLSKTIAKAEKITGQKPRVSNQTYYFTFNGYSISFMANGRSEDDRDAICFYTTKQARTEDDMNSDYWPGTFHDNLTQAFKFISKR
jgi:hypothetical protein